MSLTQIFQDTGVQALLRTSLDAVIVCDTDSRVRVWNEAAEQIFGYATEEAIGQSLEDLIIPEEQKATHGEAMQRLLSTGQPRILGKRVQVVAHCKNGQRIHVELAVAQIEEGDQTFFIARVRDITAEKAIQERQQLLLHELNHRVRNTLTIVQSLVTHTLRNANVDQSVTASISQRILALAAAHSVLSEENWVDSDITKVLDTSLSAHTRINRSGTSVRLRPSLLISVSLLVHELATNAVKYGALSVPEGSVKVTWKVETGSLLLTWVESGGPLVVHPERRGVGTQLMERLIKGEPGSDLTFDFRPEGLLVKLIMPLELMETPAESPPFRPRVYLGKSPKYPDEHARHDRPDREEQHAHPT
jgi:PAS domain S-box-containing protein